MKKNYYVFVFLLLIFSCSKNNENFGTYQEDKDFPQTRVPGDKVYESVGYGYDITGQFIHPNFTKAEVIDVKLFKQSQPGNLYINNFDDKRVTVIGGSSAEDFSKNMSKKVDASANFLGFGGSLKSTYNSSESYHIDYSFAYLDLIYQKKLVSLNSNPLELRKYITGHFRNDVNNMSASDVVLKYGTHVLTKIILGGKLDVVYRAKNETNNKSETVKHGVTAKVKAIFNTSVNIETNTTYASKNSEQSLFYRTVGGSGNSYAYTYLGDVDKPVKPVDLSSWEKSVTIDNSTLVSVVEDSMIPIYELVENPTKRAALKKAVEDYIIQKEIKNVNYKKIPLYVYFNPKQIDHYYTIDFSGNLIDHGKSSKWYYQRIEGYVFDKKVPGTVPLYSYFNHKNVNHFITTNWNELRGGDRSWNYERILGYVFPNKVYGTVSLYRYYNKRFGNHFYTTEWNPEERAISGDIYEGIQCYIYK